MPRRELAERCLVSEPTIQSLEEGDPRVSLGILLRALYVLGLHEEFENLAAPENDPEGLEQWRRDMPKRVHAPKRLEDEP
jgi:transcriptional regulator with XRE-family HTH domain